MVTPMTMVTSNSPDDPPWYRGDEAMSARS